LTAKPQFSRVKPVSFRTASRFFINSSFVATGFFDCNSWCSVLIRIFARFFASSFASEKVIFGFFGFWRRLFQVDLIASEKYVSGTPLWCNFSAFFILSASLVSPW
jgi:hypothetical protein